MPVLGLVADRHGPAGAFTLLTVVPLVAMVLCTRLKEPGRQIEAPISARAYTVSS